MTARWHLGPITGAELWRILVFSPEILVFLFFMITDPKTVPDSREARRAFGAAIGLLAVLLIAPRPPSSRRRWRSWRRSPRSARRDPRSSWRWRPN